MLATSTTPRCRTSDLAQQYVRVRARSALLVSPLSPEDAVVQSMPDASPSKWHLAHTTWFFETFVLGMQPGYTPWRADWGYLFNSYYEAVGPRHARPQRGLLTRPTLDEVLEYRQRIDERVLRLLADPPDHNEELLARVELGLQHEQQHQELLLTDIKHLLSLNPLSPAYRADLPILQRTQQVPLRFLVRAEGMVETGHDGAGFAYDCEMPRHRQWLQAHAIANRPVNNAEYREFVRDGGYRTASLWLSEAWATVEREDWSGPLYWSADASSEFTLAGEREIDPLAPVCHISYYEADAFARWAGARLPTEAEWESLATEHVDVALPAGHFADDGMLQPRAPIDGPGPLQLFGDVWEWTASPFTAYPRYRPPTGALGEYNGKFMCGQWVLRGGSCASPAGHLRPSYRNFFYPKDRWQFMGARLARDS